MNKLIFIFILVVSVRGHQNGSTSNTFVPSNDDHKNDADLQVALMPQELNTAFIPNQSGKKLPSGLQALMPQELNPIFDAPYKENAIVVGWAPVYYIPKTTPSPKTASLPDKHMPKDTPWKTIIPLQERTRRNLDNMLVNVPPTTAQVVKKYSRILTCVTLVISAVIEVVVFLIEWHHRGDVV